MRLFALAALLLLAGCLAPSDDFARKQAEAAPAATEAALGPDGAARGQVVRFDVAGPGGRIGFESVVDYHAGDAWTTTLRYFALEQGSDNRTEAAAAMRVALACTPERLVARVTGGAALGVADSDLETANPIGTCRPSPAGETAFRNATARLLPEDVRLASDLAGLAGAPDVPDMVLKTAEWQPDSSIRATYDATQDGSTVPLDAVVRDARLQRTHASVSDGAVSGEATVTYRYGQRTEAPGWRGAATV